MRKQIVHDSQFLCGQFDGFPGCAAHKQVGLIGELQIAGCPPAFFLPSQLHADAGCEFLKMERFCHVVICACLQTMQPVLQRAPCRQHDHLRGDPLLFQRGQNVKSRCSRQHDVQDDQVVDTAQSLHESRVSVQSHIHAMVLPLQP